MTSDRTITTCCSIYASNTLCISGVTVKEISPYFILLPVGNVLSLLRDGFLVMDQTGIIVVSVCGAVVVIGVLVLLYFTVFQHMKLKKNVKVLSNRFDKSHALLIGQVYQYVKRLETIVATNLTYGDDYNEWNRKFKDARDTEDANAQAAINQIQDMVTERRYADLKEVLPACRSCLDKYEATVNNLNSSLHRKFQEEENCRELAFQQREEFRKVKQDYNNKVGDLSLVTSSFEIIFDRISELFETANSSIESANYSDARTVLTNQIAPITEQLATTLKVLPTVCVKITTLLPEKISRLSHRYDELLEQDYPLHHIMVKGDIATLETELNRVANKVQGLDLQGVEASLDGIASRIDDYSKKFDLEVNARKSFENGCDGIYKEETALESSFIGLCHSLPKIKKIYLIDDVEQKKIDNIQDLINKAGGSKRALDTYTNSNTHQPYTILVEKMEALDKCNKDASSALSELENFLNALKKDTERAFNDLSNYYVGLRNAEKEVRRINIPALSARFEKDFDDLHIKIDDLFEVLKTTPIDVDQVRKLHHILKEDGDTIFMSVEQTEKELGEAEKKIMEANRKRGNSSDVNSTLAQAEGFFFNADFKHAYEAALNAERIAKDIG